MPKISIITTTYSHQDFIKYTIESILSQTFTDWELLIWDDSPDDLTWTIIQDYVKKYSEKIKYWHNSTNKWLVNNMNFLLEKVSNDSKYIAFLEWDDIFTPDNLEKKLQIFEENKDTWMVYNNLDFINLKWEIFYHNALIKSPFYLRNEKLSKFDLMKYETFYISYSTLMIKKEILETEKIINPTNDKMYSVSDWDLFFRISTKYNCYWIEESLTLYRRHIWNVSGNNLKLFNDLEIQINEYLKNWFIDIKLFNIKLSFINLLKSVYYLEKNNKKESFKCLFNSFKLNFLWNIFYKVWILVFLFLPNSLNQKIFKKMIKRW